MPSKLERCVKEVMADGKTEEQAYAICNASIKDIKGKQFSDRIAMDTATKTLISVRDGILEYYGSELGIEPGEKVFTVYRSPATIANISPSLSGLPMTDEHVEVGSSIEKPIGTMKDSCMVDLIDQSVNSTLGIKNTVDLDASMLSLIDSGKRELSLGYNADLVPHDVYDFEQRDIIPHHLAVVPSGRCGSACSFIDKTKEESQMKKKLNKAFLDADGQINLQQVVEIAMQLPDALKNIPMEELTKVLPMLQEIVTMGKEGDAAEESEPPAEEMTETPEQEAAEPPQEEMTDEDMPEEDKKDFSDSKAFQDAVRNAKFEHAKVIQKAKDFVDAEYSFEDKDTKEIMRDAVATQTKQQFSDEELPVAFKMLQKQSRYVNFGDSKEADTSLSARIEQSLEG